MTPIRSLIARAATAVALATAAIVLTAGPANATTTADTWAVIAISVETGNIGYSYDQPTAAAAANAAVEQCAAGDCQEAVRVANGCAAVAQAPNRAWGWAYGPTREAAENEAIGSTPGSGAKVLVWTCTGSR